MKIHQVIYEFVNRISINYLNTFFINSIWKKRSSPIGYENRGLKSVNNCAQALHKDFNNKLKNQCQVLNCCIVLKII